MSKIIAHRQWLALAGVGLLVVVVSLLSSQRVPLFDGIGFPDEPYRYVVAPNASKKTKLPPAVAKTTLPVKDGLNSGYGQLASTETGPQIAIYLSGNSLQAGSDAKNIYALATPLAPDADKPNEGAIAGDIYRFSATSDDGPVKFVAQSTNPTYVDLRLPQGYPQGATIVYRATPQGAWTTFITDRVGNDIYQAPLIGLGDYGLISTPDKSTKQSSTKKPIALVIAIIGLLIGIGLAVVLIRTRTNEDDSPN